jgi:DNA polymerase-3 subunit delta'
MANKIVISSDLDVAYQKVVNEAITHNIITYSDDEFKIADARDLISHAYIASESEKYLIVKAKRYNDVSQNALLKILEEPPKNINIYLLGNSKSIFLPTIRSRLVVESIKSTKQNIDIDFDFNRLDIASIYKFGKDNGRFMDKEVAKHYVTSLFEQYLKKVVKPKEDILNFFGNAISLINLNSNPQSVIITLMLMMNDKKTS